MPSVAEHELDEHGELVFDILELRAAAKAYAVYHHQWSTLDQRTKQALSQDPLIVEVVRLDFDDAQEALSGRGDGDDRTGHPDPGVRSPG